MSHNIRLRTAFVSLQMKIVREQKPLVLLLLLLLFWQFGESLQRAVVFHLWHSCPLLPHPVAVSGKLFLVFFTELGVRNILRAFDVTANEVLSQKFTE